MPQPLQPFLPTRWLVTNPATSLDPSIFPMLPGQMFITEKAPNWSTGIAIAASGRERRQKRWSYPQWTFKVQYEFLRDGPTLLEQQILLAFFNLHAGQFSEFKYLDPSDKAVSGQSFGVGDGSTKTFQLQRTIGMGQILFTEPVLAVSGDPSIFINGVQTSAFSVGSYGAVTFNSAPAAGAKLTWSGTFFFVCRFDQDNLPIAQMMQGLWSQDGLSFRGIRL